jgi:hypothetical protein
MTTTAYEADMTNRCISNNVLTKFISIPTLPARLAADCEREISMRLQLVPGDVETLSLARARTRWPGYRSCVQALTDWLRELGLPEILPDGDIALMACRGARYHHDAEQYGDKAFCNLFLSEDKGLDLHFPHAAKRIALKRGSVVIFDTGQPHAVIARNSQEFCTSDFPAERDCTLLFLTWELPIKHPALAQALGLTFDAKPSSAPWLIDQQLTLNGEPIIVCPRTGQWLITLQ